MESAKSQTDKWDTFHENALPYEDAIRQEPFKTFLTVMAEFVCRHKVGAVFEAGFGTGYLIVALAERLPKLRVIGTDNSPGALARFERLARRKKVIGLHGASGGAVTLTKEHPDIFDWKLYKRYGTLAGLATQPAPHTEKGFAPSLVIYHQGLLEHFDDLKIRQLLRLQLPLSIAVIFSVPSAFYLRQDFGDERLLSLEQWQEILIPFDLLKLEYYDEKKHILGILKGDFYAG